MGVGVPALDPPIGLWVPSPIQTFCFESWVGWGGVGGMPCSFQNTCPRSPLTYGPIQGVSRVPVAARMAECCESKFIFGFPWSNLVGPHTDIAGICWGTVPKMVPKSGCSGGLHRGARDCAARAAKAVRGCRVAVHSTWQRQRVTPSPLCHLPLGWPNLVG